MKIARIIILMFTVSLYSCNEFSDLGFDRVDDPENYERISLQDVIIDNGDGFLRASWSVHENPLFDSIVIEYSYQNSGATVQDVVGLQEYETSATINNLPNGVIVDLVFITRDVDVTPINSQYHTGIPNSGTVNLDLITNANLRSAVQSLGTTDIASITSLDITDGSLVIDDLTGISQLTALQTLNLENQQIVDLSPLRTCKDITNLNLSNNKIQDPHILSYLGQLVTLDLQNNLITDIDGIQYLNSLISLNLANNYLTTNVAELLYMDSLQTLDISNNDNIPAEDMAAITGSTHLTIITDTPSVISLDLTAITDVALRGAVSDIITAEGYSNYGDVTSLAISGITATTLDGLGIFPNITVFSLDSCALSDLSGLAEMTGIEELTVSNCNLDDTMMNNYFYDLPSSLMYITALDVSNNDFGNLTWLTNYTAITGLNISGCTSLDDFDLSEMSGLTTNLITLDMSNNPNYGYLTSISSLGSSLNHLSIANDTGLYLVNIATDLGSFPNLLTLDATGIGLTVGDVDAINLTLPSLSITY